MPVTVTYPIVSNSDDGSFTGLFADNTVDFTQCRLSRVTPSDVVNSYGAFLRFVDIDIPNGATISRARLRITPNASYSNNMRLAIDAAAEDNVGPLDADSEFSTQERTDAQFVADISGSPWLVNTVQTYTITSVIQEIINRAGWVEGNALMLLVEMGTPFFTAIRTFYDYNEDPSKSATLEITYTGEGSSSESSSSVEEISVCERIAVDQPQGGSNYPLIEPSEEVRQVLLDFYLSYDDDTAEFVLPFHIDWLYGFGANSVAQPAGTPTPTHDLDLRVRDVNGVTVFDSTTSSDFVTRPWGSSKEIAEWTTSSMVCRAVRCTGAEAENDNHIRPASAILDARTTDLIPIRIRSVTLDDTTISSGDLLFAGGYNTDLVVESPDLLDGGPATTEITIDSEPGAGIGRFNGCDEEESYVRTIAGIPSDIKNNWILGADECYRVERPTRITSEEPRLAELYYADDPAIDAKAALLLSNNCGPCCDCDEFAAVWEGIRRLRERYNEYGLRAAAIRDKHRENILRWRDAGRDRASEPLRLSIIPISCCLLGVSGGYCNASGDFIPELTLQFDVSGSVPAGVTVCGQTFRAGNFQRVSPASAGRIPTASRETYELEGVFPKFTARFTGVPAGGLVVCTFQLLLEGCSSSDKVIVGLKALNSTTGETLQYDASWPKGENMQDVPPLSVNSQLIPNNPCDESDCDADEDHTSGSGPAPSSSSSSVEPPTACCETIPAAFSVRVSNIPETDCPDTDGFCDSYMGTYQADAGFDSGQGDLVCDFGRWLDDGFPICGTTGKFPCLGVQLDARTEGKLIIYVFLQQNCHEEYATFKKVLSVSGDVDCMSLIQNLIIPYDSSTDTMECDLSAAIVTISALS